MTTDINSHMPLKEIVSFAMDEVQSSEAAFDRYWLLAFRALVKLKISMAAEPATVRMPVSPNKTVPFPPGSITWTKIGVLNDHGELSSLKINRGLTTWKDTNPNRLSQIGNADIQSGLPFLLDSPYFFNYYQNGVFQPLFGVGGGLIQYGSCTVDEENRVVVLEPDFRYDHIFFEGIFAPEKNGDYTVPITLLEPIVAFIKWKDKKGTREEFISESIEARRSMPKKRMSLQVINQVLRESEAMKLRS